MVLCFGFLEGGCRGDQYDKILHYSVLLVGVGRAED